MAQPSSICLVVVAMELVSCEHPVRVHNKYNDTWLYVPCGRCNTCKNRKKSVWVSRLESERSKSLCSYFVTLTYDDSNLPYYYFDTWYSHDDLSDYRIRNSYYESSRFRDSDPIAFSDLNVLDGADFDLFKGLLKNNGIPYCSKTDIQLFHKRLNKYIHDVYTHKFKNFRYFLVSEYGATTLRPHYHAIYFINDSEVARHFTECVLACWKFGRIDSQRVEKSACAYVSEYINKSSDYPSFYQAGPLSTFTLYSRNPFIGNGEECAEVDKESFNECIVTRCVPSSKNPTAMDIVTNDQTFENRLYPKCVLFKQISHSLRVELYSITRRFAGQAKKFSQFFMLVRAYMHQTYESEMRIFHFESDFARIIYEYFYLPYTSKVDKEIQRGIEWLRRLYYLSKKVCKRAYIFRISIDAYVQKIEEYYNKKELYILKMFYEFQENYSNNNDSIDLVLCYPHFVAENGFTLAEYASEIDCSSYFHIVEDAKQKAFERKRTHFKNAYLQSLKDKVDYQYLFNLLISFYHAKKCNETLEAIAPSCA